MARCPANGAEAAGDLHRLRAAEGVVVAGRCSNSWPSTVNGEVESGPGARRGTATGVDAVVRPVRRRDGALLRCVAHQGGDKAERVATDKAPTLLADGRTSTAMADGVGAEARRGPARAGWPTRARRLARRMAALRTC